jgi:hypothetical protein
VGPILRTYASKLGVSAADIDARITAYSGQLDTRATEAEAVAPPAPPPPQTHPQVLRPEDEPPPGSGAMRAGSVGDQAPM